MDALTQQFEGLAIQKSAVHKFMTGECRLSLKKITLHPEERNAPATIEKRFNWATKWGATDLDFVMNCVFIDEAAFNINLRRTLGYSSIGKPATVVTKSTRARSHSILGAICAAGVVQVSIRKPATKKPTTSKNRKLGNNAASKRVGRGGTRTDHYICFLETVMDVMDQHVEFQNYHLVMDNAPIHQSTSINELFTNRGYRCVYLPPYSPELNPNSAILVCCREQSAQG